MCHVVTEEWGTSKIPGVFPLNTTGSQAASWGLLCWKPAFQAFPSSARTLLPEEEPTQHRLPIQFHFSLPFSILGQTARSSRFQDTHLEPSLSLQHLCLALVSDLQPPPSPPPPPETLLSFPTFPRLLSLCPNFGILISHRMGVGLCSPIWG